jgi:hypothetical protein
VHGGGDLRDRDRVVAALTHLASIGSEANRASLSIASGSGNYEIAVR